MPLVGGGRSERIAAATVAWAQYLVEDKQFQGPVFNNKRAMPPGAGGEKKCTYVPQKDRVLAGGMGGVEGGGE